MYPSSTACSSSARATRANSCAHDGVSGTATIDATTRIMIVRRGAPLYLALLVLYVLLAPLLALLLLVVVTPLSPITVPSNALPTGKEWHSRGTKVGLQRQSRKTCGGSTLLCSNTLLL